MQYFFPLLFFSVAVFAVFALLNHIPEIVDKAEFFANSLTSIISFR
ncbi:MAG: hypothetical protein HYT03_02365 [Candidatus Harrisonbacteria bacterium]|nr:hypothetical protein [Candidatus Harrisonbacteria bacterium]